MAFSSQIQKVSERFGCERVTLVGDRPVYVRKEETTRGHVLVVMLAYMIVKQLRYAKNSQIVENQIYPISYMANDFAFYWNIRYKDITVCNLRAKPLTIFPS